MKNKLEQYLHDEIKSYKKKIEEVEKKKTTLSDKTDLEDYQRVVLFKTENDFIEHYNNRIKDSERILKDEYFIYGIDLLISDNTLKPTHIFIILDAYWKLKKFEDAKINTKSHKRTKRKNQTIPDSIAMMRKDLTESLRFANYSDEAITIIVRVVLNNLKSKASQTARKQDEKTKDGRTIHIFQTSSKIE